MTMNLISNIMSQSAQPEPEVGMAASICLYTDRHAATVVRVDRFKSGARKGQVRYVYVQRDKAIRTDGGGMTDAQSYRYERDPEASVERYSLSAKGRYKGPYGTLALGERSEFYDFSF